MVKSECKYSNNYYLKFQLSSSCTYLFNFCNHLINYSFITIITCSSNSLVVIFLLVINSSFSQIMFYFSASANYSTFVGI